MNLLVLLVLAGVISLTVVFAKTRYAASITLPPDGQGLYENCTTHTLSWRGTTNDCAKHLDKMAAGGFTLVLNYGVMYGDIKDILAYADHAHALGIKIIWSMNDVTYRNGDNGGKLWQLYTELGSDCKCSDNQSFIIYVVNALKNHPATYGWYIGDEVPPNENKQPGLPWLAQLVKRLDPKHPLLTVGTAAKGVSEIYYYYPQSMVDTTDMIGIDYYPYGDAVRGSSLDTNTARIVAATQALADSNHKPTYFVLQAFSWGEDSNPPCSPAPSCASFPTYDQMRVQRDEVLQNAHPRFILWYSYFDLNKSENSTQHWADLIAAAGAKPLSTSPLFSSLPIFIVIALPFPLKHRRDL